MGFFDKVKTFVGGSSMVNIEFTEIERQPAHSATLPIGDSVVKGNFKITAVKDCVVLAHIAEFRTRWAERDGTLGTMHVEDRVDEKNQVIGAPYQFPYTLKAGQVMEAGFCIGDVRIQDFLMKSYGVPTPNAPIEVFIKVIVDVKGSPFDPECEQKLTIV
ncbi:MAG: hypothetical protein U0269_19535 [Polyangiales bacterium]